MKPEDAQGQGPRPKWRDRVTQAAGRAAQKMDLDPEAALAAAQTTLDWALRNRGPGSPVTVSAMSEVADRLERLGRFDDALETRSEVAAQMRATFGAEDLRTLEAEALQGLNLDRLGRSKVALPFFEHVLAGRTSELGRDDASTLKAMEWLGCAQRNAGNLQDSRRLLEEAVDRYGALGAGETEDCLRATSHLATSLFQLELFPDSCQLRRHILEVRSRTLGPDDPTTLSSLQNLATALWWAGALSEAKVIARSLLDKRLRVSGEADAHTQQARALLTGIEDALSSD